MLKVTSPTSDRSRTFKNLQDDLYWTLKENPALRISARPDFEVFILGKYILKGIDGSPIESFEVNITVKDKYPHSFPKLYELGEIERHEDNHIGIDGEVCTDFTRIRSLIAQDGIRIYDFVNHYLKKYFSWYLVKKVDPSYKLDEWSHNKAAFTEFYAELLELVDPRAIISFLENYLLVYEKPGKCPCGSRINARSCHWEQIKILKSLGKDIIAMDVQILRAMNK